MDEHKKMIEESFEIYARVWKAMPHIIRPTKSEVGIYERILRKIKKDGMKVLILGATPEFRDLTTKLGIETTIVDVNPVMIKSMNLLMSQKPAKEKVIIGDWLSFKTGEKYDVVLSDCSINMLPWPRFEDLVRKVAGVLKDDGYWLGRVCITPKGFNFPSWDESWKFIRKYPNDPWEAINCMLATVRDKDWLMPVPKVLERLKQDFDAGKMTEEEYNKLKIPNPKMSITYPSEEEFDKVFSKYFTLMSKELGSEFFSCRWGPVYFGKVSPVLKSSSA